MKQWQQYTYFSNLITGRPANLVLISSENLSISVSRISVISDYTLSVFFIYKSLYPPPLYVKFSHVIKYLLSYASIHTTNTYEHSHNDRFITSHV